MKSEILAASRPVTSLSTGNRIYVGFSHLLGEGKHSSPQLFSERIPVNGR